MNSSRITTAYLGGALGLLLFSAPLQAQTLTPSDTTATDNLNPANVGVLAVNSGVTGDLVIRERANAAQNDRRISSYINFDLTDPAVATVIASPLFTASFSVEYNSQLNSLNGGTVSLGRVTTAAWDSTANFPLHSYGLEAGVGTNAAELSVLINNVATTTPSGQTFTVDVTNIVRAWVDGSEPNYGLVLFFNQLVSQGAGFNNPQLIFTIPDDDDNDGIPNDYEIANGLDPAVDDSALDNDLDGGADGLTNLEEFLAGTNPNDSDSDNDGLLDGEEVNGTLNPFQGDQAGDTATTAPGLATDPLVADSDNDGLNDFAELDNTNGSISNPLTNDTDGDTLLDPYEVANGLDPTDATGDNGITGDPDIDTLTNFQEQAAGTNPNASDSDGDTLNDAEELNTHSTDPLNPDTDGDNLNDDTEVAGDTDPILPDSDFDGFLDSVEIAAASDPNSAASTPSFPIITWSVEVLDEETDLLTDGPLLFAENLNGIATTVNGIPFDSAIDNAGTQATPNFLTQITGFAGLDTFYLDEVPAFTPLFESSWTGGDESTVTIFGLTPGLPYAIQVGRGDDRDTGTIQGRYLTIDGFGGENAAEPTGPDNTIFGGSANPELLFTGSFVATETVQSFEVSQFLAGGGGGGGPVINFLQVRQADLLTTLPITAISAEFTGGAFEITFENLSLSRNYQLVRSLALDDGFPTIVASARNPISTTDTFSDPSPTETKAFYRLEEVPTP